MGSAVTAVPPRVYLDANVFIAALENPGAHSDHAWWILEAIERNEIFGATSEITIAELLVKPIELGDLELAASYEKMIMSTDGFEVLPVHREILVEAAGIRARRSSIKLPDAIHVATARTLSCSFFLSGDRRLSLPEGIKPLTISPFTLDDIFDQLT
jgi:predicted nucleic acid-binding protein